MTDEQIKQIKQIYENAVKKLSTGEETTGDLRKALLLACKGGLNLIADLEKEQKVSAWLAGELAQSFHTGSHHCPGARGDWNGCNSNTIECDGDFDLLRAKKCNLTEAREATGD